MDELSIVVTHFSNLSDPRVNRTKRHKLIDIITIAICAVIATAETGSKVTVERRYFISSLAENLIKFSEAVRSHWLIENRLHWTLDVTFNEDRSRIRKDHAPENFSVLRHLALSLLRQTPKKRLSVKTKRLRAGWDNAFLLEVLLAGGKKI